MKNRLSKAFGACLCALILGHIHTSAAIYRENGGIVVIEAEHFDSRTTNLVNNHHWHLVPDDDGLDFLADTPAEPAGGFTNARDKYIQSLPESGANNSTDANVTRDPLVNYKVYIRTPGTYRLYLRWRGYDGNSDSMYASIVEFKDGIGGTHADWYNFNGGGSVNFNGSWRTAQNRERTDITNPAGGAPADWVISNPGVYTIQLSYREDGAAVDTLSLQLSSMAAPADPGPAESATATNIPPFLKGWMPGLGQNGVFPDTRIAFEIEEVDRPLDTNSVRVALNGEAIAATIAKTPGGVAVNYTPSSLFPAGSTNQVQVIFADTGTPAGRYTNSWTFVVENYVTFTAADALPASAVEGSGFTVKIAQGRDDARWPGADLPNDTRRGEDQLAGRLRDPVTALPMPNFALPGPGLGGSFALETINWNQEMNDGGNLAEIGNFQTSSSPSFPDQPIPGIPGTDPDGPGNRDNIAGEAIAYLELKAGLNRLGVNSDDGFRVTTAPNVRDNTGRQMAVFSGGRGSADSLFNVLVNADGIYPVRLIWYEGGGGANLEFFSVDIATGQKTLINDRSSARGVKAYPRTAGTVRPYVSVSPLPGATDVLGSAVITAHIFDQASKAQTNSIVLKINGTDVTPVISRLTNAVLVAYDAAGLLPSSSTQDVTLIYTDDGTPAVTRTNTWSFRVQNWSSFPVIPASLAIPASSVDLNSSGFTLDVYQMGDGAGGVVARADWNNNNVVNAAEKQHARRYLDPATGLPRPNNIAPGPVGGKYTVETINWNQTAPTADGTFTAAVGFEDQPFPGIDPGDTALQNWMVIEAIAYLELKAGIHTFNIQCDDGYKVTTGPAPEDPNNLLLGLRSPGGGTTSAPFTFIVQQDGIYPVRMLYWEGTGGADAEWFSQDPESGAAMLVNDRSRAQAVKAYRVYTGPVLVGTQPKDVMAVAGLTATLSVIANDPARATYQWLKNGQPIAGATNDTYTTATLTDADNGAKFSVQVKGPGNTDTSREAVLTVIPFTPDATFNFNDGQTPANTQVFGSAAVAANGGVNDSGVMHITTAINDQTGAWRIAPFEAGAEIGAFTAVFDLYIGNGTARPADGASFNFAPDLPAGTYAQAEEGSGTGVSVVFDVWDSGGPAGEAPAIDVKYKGVVVSSHKLFHEDINNERFTPVIVRQESDGTVDVVFDGRVIHSNVQLPNFTPISGGYFGFGARTGGANEDHFVDNVRIDVTKSTAPVRITAQPVSATVLPGKVVSFSVTVSDPTSSTYQWFKNNTAITGATNNTYSTEPVTAGDNGAKFHMEVTSPGGKILSDQATLTVLVIPVPPNPDARFDFNNNQLPVGTVVSGTAAVADGVIKLTEAIGSQQGSFFIPDVESGRPVNEFTVAFKARIGGGSTPPADGMSFVWAPGLNTSASFGEQGTGNGLIVSIDTYNNGAGEAPALDVWYNGVEVATTKLPTAKLATGDAFVDVLIRLQPDGTVDVAYNGEVIYNNLALANFTAQTGAFFAFGGRTGGLTDNHWIDDVVIAAGPSTPSANLRISRQAGQITITWDAGVLVAAPVVTGPYQPVSNATSPYAVNPTGSAMFYQVRLP